MSWRSHSVEYLSDNLFFETLLSSTTSHSASIYILRPKSRLSQSYDTRHDILQLSSAHSSSLQLSSALFSSLQLTMVWSFRPQRGTIQRYCNNFLDDQPTAYLDEMQQFLYDEYELEASIATISRTLKRAKWSRKAVRARAAERS